MQSLASTVYVVDDDPACRVCVQEILERMGVRVLVFETAQAFLSGYDANSGPACLVLDVRLPGESGVELQRQLAARGIGIPIIFLSGLADVTTATECMRAGAYDFLEKPFRPQAFLDRVGQALAFDRQRLEEDRCRREASSRFQKLSAREQQVIDLLVHGMVNKQIAAHLHISEKTVETHRASAVRKLHTHSVLEIIRLHGLANGLIRNV